MFAKKINLFLLPITLAAGAQAQKTKLQGNIEGLNDPFIIIYDAGTVKKFDTVHVKNGKFTWKAKLPNPQKLTIRFPKEILPLYAGKGKIRITGHVDSLKQLRISGSPLQEEANEYYASIKHFNDEINAINQQYNKASKDEQKVLLENWERLQLQKKEKLAQHVAAHSKSYFSVDLIADEASNAEYPDIKPLYDLLDPTLLQSLAGKKLSDRLALLKRSAPGEPMLSFTQNSVDGRPVHFADFKGKYVFVDFWASWCAPCRAENPNVLAAYNRYKDKNFTVLGISLDDKEEKWKKAIKDDKLPWTQVSDLKGFQNQVSAYYGIRGIPSTLLVGPDGKIIAKDLRGEALHKKLAELLDK
jgi:thiol-disulfide isomerase/thioredoxin